MKRLIHAMAALGAALVFGCGQPPETSGDGSDIGQAEQAATVCQYMGEEVTPTGAVTANACYSTFAHEPYQCALAALYGRSDSVRWAWDPMMNTTQCVGHFEPTGFEPMADVPSITSGINAWSIGTGLTFSFTTDAPSADVLVGCATAAAQATGDPTWATTAPTGSPFGTTPDPVGAWGSTKPTGATNPLNALRVKQHRIIIHDGSIAKALDTCPGAVTGAARQQNMHKFMAALMAHEMGHVLGFGDYSSLGMMSLHMGVCNQPSVAQAPPELAAAAGSMRGRFNLGPGSPVAFPCQNVPVPLKGSGNAMSPAGDMNGQYGATVRDMIECGAWDSGNTNSKAFHGSTLPPPGGRLTPDVTDGVTGTFMSLPPTDYGLPPFIGSKIAYTDNMTFGIQTGGAHLSCNWSSTSQQCAFPHTYVFDWCFKSGVTDAQFKTDFRTLTGLTAAQGSWNIPQNYGYAVWRYHNSCNDAGVNLTVDNGACSGTNSANIDGYVCLDMPTMTVAESIINDSGFTAPGTYYNWQGQPNTNTWIEMHVDAADIAARVATSTEKTLLFKHAAQAGLNWVQGIGSRTDVTDKVMSRAVLPYAKVGSSFPWQPPGNSTINVVTNLTQGEYCKSYYHSYPSSFVAAYPKGMTYITQYCGAD